MTRSQELQGGSLRVVVTGGAGFIGSHLCRRLLQDGHEVVAVDNLMSGSRENVDELLANERFHLIERDVVGGLLDVVPGPVHRVYNLACPASPRQYQRDPVHTTLTSVVGAYSCLRLAERWSAHCLLASTSEVYGDPDVHPQREDYRGNVSCVGPRACYDEGKRCAEALMMDYRRSNSFPIRVARIFNTYGPRMALDDGRVISNFVVQALRGEALTIYGDGSQTRSLCYVDDLIEGLVAFMEHSAVSGPINLGNPEEMSVLEIAERVIRQIGEGRIVHRPLPEDDPRRRKPDISAAGQAFSFSPKVSFEEGLRATIAYFKTKVRPGGADEIQGVIDGDFRNRAGRRDGVHLPALAVNGGSRLDYRLPEQGIDFRELERDVLAQALRLASGNQTRAAALLGLTRDQIRYRMAKFGIVARDGGVRAA